MRSTQFRALGHLSGARQVTEAMRGHYAVANSFTRWRRSCDPSAESEATGLILGTDLRPANIRTAAFGNTLNALEVSVWRSLIARRPLWWRSSHRMVSTFRSSSPEHRVHHHRPWPTVPRHVYRVAHSQQMHCGTDATCAFLLVPMARFQRLRSLHELASLEGLVQLHSCAVMGWLTAVPVEPSLLLPAAQCLELQSLCSAGSAGAPPTPLAEVTARRLRSASLRSMPQKAPGC